MTLSAPTIDPRRVSAAGWVLAGLVAAGVAVRVVVAVSWWPASTKIADSWSYAYYAAGDVLASPQHSAGYSLLLAGLGSLTRSLPVFTILQHLAGIVSALLLFAAVRRLTGSWAPATVPAAVVLLGADQIHLEHAIMSEGPFLLLISGSLYAAVRALEDDERALAWAAGAAALAAAASVVRSAGAPMLLTLLLVLLLARPGRLSWRPALVAGAVGFAVLGAYASANLAANGWLGTGPAPGWHLYARTAQFADCDEFDPPPGTAALCERSSPAARRSPQDYLFDLGAPGHQVFGRARDPARDAGTAGWAQLVHDNLRHDDDALGAFGRAALLAQPADYARIVGRDMARYWLPGLPSDTRGGTVGLSPQLDFGEEPGPGSLRATEIGMQSFFDPFQVRRRPAGIAFLEDYQRVFRFGAALLSICTVLILLGLVAGTRRSRIGVLLFGVGGIAMLVPSVLLAMYTGRYSVPAAGPIAAGAAIAAWGLWKRRPPAVEGSPNQVGATA